jgi:hypothetical protein
MRWPNPSPSPSPSLSPNPSPSPRPRPCLGLILFWMVLLLACSSSVQETTTGAFFQLEVATMTQTFPSVLLVAVDDGAESASLRQSIAIDKLTQNLTGLVFDPGTDPATWVSANVHVFVVHSSTPDTVVGPITLETVHVQQSDVRTLAESVLVEIQRPASVERVNEVLAAARSANDLLFGRRAPTSSDEARLVATLPSIGRRHTAVISARDDASPDPPESYALAQDPMNDAFFVGTIGARTDAWKRASHASIMEPGWVFPESSWEGSCMFPFGRTVDSCTVTIAASTIGSCDELRGWRDPLGKPTWHDYGLGPERVCEITPLDGPCTFDSDPGASGFCIAPHPLCGRSLRFIHRAFPFMAGFVHTTVTCAG